MKTATKITMEFTPDGATTTVMAGDEVLAVKQFGMLSRGSGTTVSEDFFEQLGNSNEFDRVQKAFNAARKGWR